MKNFFVLLSTLILFIGCVGYNFEYGSSLSNFQEEKFRDYKENKPLTKEEKIRFEKNLWVKMAEELAKNNLVVRHFCLMDLYEGKSRHKERLQEQLDELGKDIWKESYSYWLYTKPLLVEYDKKFKNFGSFIKAMDEKFQKTAYMGIDGKLYPAPYGDLKHVPLENHLQSANPVSSEIKIYPLIIRIIQPDITEYFVQKCPIGFNTHVPSKTQTVRVIGNDTVCVLQDNGDCTLFKWYEGYDKKYKDKEEEFNDIFSDERINSLNVKKLWKKYIEIFCSFK